MQQIIDITKTYYCSWEQLILYITQKLAFYTRISPVFRLLKQCGLRPGYMLDATHPAYFTDEIAAHCLATYDEDEPMDQAMERCIADKLHLHMTRMERTDLTKVKMDDDTWELYSLDSLLRLAWRHRESGTQIPFYLQKESMTELSDPFVLEMGDGCVCLSQRTLDRQYAAELEQMDFEAFCKQVYRFFRLATEHYGYFVPAFVWLSHGATAQVRV